MKMQFLTSFAVWNLLDLETRNSVEKEKEREEIEERLLREGKEFLINYLMKQLHIVSYLYNSHNASYC
jgi:hypothetical protein